MFKERLEDVLRQTGYERGVHSGKTFTSYSFTDALRAGLFTCASFFFFFPRSIIDINGVKEATQKKHTGKYD